MSKYRLDRIEASELFDKLLQPYHLSEAQEIVKIRTARVEKLKAQDKLSWPPSELLAVDRPLVKQPTYHDKELKLEKDYSKAKVPPEKPAGETATEAILTKKDIVQTISTTRK